MLSLVIFKTGIALAIGPVVFQTVRLMKPSLGFFRHDGEDFKWRELQVGPIGFGYSYPACEV